MAELPSCTTAGRVDKICGRTDEGVGIGKDTDERATTKAIGMAGVADANLPGPGPRIDDEPSGKTGNMGTGKVACPLFNVWSLQKIKRSAHHCSHLPFVNSRDIANNKNACEIFTGFLVATGCKQRLQNVNKVYIPKAIKTVGLP